MLCIAVYPHRRATHGNSKSRVHACGTPPNGGAATPKPCGERGCAAMRLLTHGRVSEAGGGG
ncbi:hypothetical protein WS67_08390 [Burkholderia singularis]|uniref:Uncharacterized protein n=1 Tax=Burkholderia singularis TaxID=1503053 RepID=A0A103E5F7_9BURK|nr:hypothetical protein AQ611_17825 [Burkholderia sp. Bp7605]KVE28722.1 hypothetical protein WS67_08390 [Burkholderia singularis]